MDGLDAGRSVAGGAWISSGEPIVRRRQDPVPLQLAGKTLHRVFPSTVVGVLSFQLRAGLRLVLECQGIRPARGHVRFLLDADWAECLELFRNVLALPFQLRPMVVFLSADAARDALVVGHGAGQRTCDSANDALVD